MLSFLLASLSLAAEPKHLSVDDALATLERQNPTLLRAQAAVDAAKGGTLVAWSGTLPSVSLAGSYTRNNEEATLDLGELFDFLGDLAEAMGNDRPESPGVMVLQPLEAWTGTASVKVPLVVPSTWASISGARQGVTAADANRSASVSSVRSAALSAFWSAAAAEAYVGAQEASVERAKRLVASADLAVKAGTSPRLSLLEAQTDLARREGDLLQARANLEKARIAVGAVLGETTPVAVDLPEAVVATLPEVEAAVTDAWSARPEVQAAEAQVAAARASLLSVRLGALPSLSGTFSVFGSSEEYVTGENTGWKGSVDLTWPLLQGGLRAGSEAKAKAALADAEATRDAARVSVAQQVRTATADVAVAAARVDVAGRQRALAEEGARVAQRSFDEGAADLRTVLDALDRLDVARASEIDAKARVGIADAALHAAMGRW